MSFKSLCEQHGIKYTNAVEYKRRHPELSSEEIIKLYSDNHNLHQAYLDNKYETSFKNLCKKYNINYRNAIEYKRHHPELSEEQIIELYVKSDNLFEIYTQQRKEKSLRSLCIKHDIKLINAYKYREKHPELTNEQIVEYYLNKKSNKQ